mmetsp:Transcript_11260/g.24881  ORF Transcript_11260/g.24881 Transcript_11260/m.24881 type:complete len:210 (+) Transcript_11260:48-677(+)
MGQKQSAGGAPDSTLIYAEDGVTVIGSSAGQPAYVKTDTSLVKQRWFDGPGEQIIKQQGCGRLRAEPVAALQASAEMQVWNRTGKDMLVQAGGGNVLVPKGQCETVPASSTKLVASDAGTGVKACELTGLPKHQNPATRTKVVLQEVGGVTTAFLEFTRGAPQTPSRPAAAAPAVPATDPAVLADLERQLVEAMKLGDEAAARVILQKM